MAATFREILLQFQNRTIHHGFGQEPSNESLHRPENWPLALFVQEYMRAPESEAELEAFLNARRRQELQND